MAVIELTPSYKLSDQELLQKLTPIMEEDDYDYQMHNMEQFGSYDREVLLALAQENDVKELGLELEEYCSDCHGSGDGARSCSKSSASDCCGGCYSNCETCNGTGIIEL